LWYGLIVVLFGALTLVVLAWNQPLSGSVQLRPGQVAPYDVVAPRQTSYVSELLTLQARARAADAVPEQYDSAMGSVRREQVLRLRQLIGDMTSTRGDDTVPLDDKVVILTAIPELGLSKDSARALLSLEQEDWDHVALEAPQALDRALRDEIQEGNLTGARARVAATVSAELSEPAALVAVELVQAMLRPTSYPNAARTEQMRDEARQAIAPQTVTIERGQTILRAGDIASSEDIEALEQIGLLGSQWDWWVFARAFAFAVALTLVTAGAIFRLHSDSTAARREAGILMLLVVVWLVAARMMILPHDWLPYLYPLAALSMLIACLINVRTALILTAAFALLVYFLSRSTNDGLGA
jgi:membrane-associated HD superfamily phosphohydrolase